jgi:hypothetical protein
MDTQTKEKILRVRQLLKKNSPDFYNFYASWKISNTNSKGIEKPNSNGQPTSRVACGAETRGFPADNHK